jgi:hypothetical protein
LRLQAVSPWLRIELVERPEVEALNHRHAAVVHRPDRDAVAPERTVHLLPARLAVRGTATQPLSKACSRQHRDMRVSDGKTFQLAITPADLRDGEYRVELTGTESIWLPGETGPQPLSSRTPFTFGCDLRRTASRR